MFLLSTYSEIRKNGSIFSESVLVTLRYFICRETLMERFINVWQHTFERGTQRRVADI